MAKRIRAKDIPGWSTTIKKYNKMHTFEEYERLEIKKLPLAKGQSERVSELSVTTNRAEYMSPLQKMKRFESI